MYYTVVNQLADLAVRANELLTRAAIPYQFIGGFAVFLHVRAVSEDAARTTRGIDILLGEGLPHPRRVIYLFPTDSSVTPDSIDGFCVAPLTELLQQRLTRNRLKDMMYLRDMLDAGLITPEIEASVPSALRERLEFVKAHE